MKVFGIGLSRTGTTSLSVALEDLGFLTRQFPSMRKILNAQWIKIKELRKFEAFTDAPVALHYQKLDNKYPGSKFIYTHRELEPWLQSCEEYIRFQKNYPISPQVAFIRRQLYGSIHFEKNAFREAFQVHHESIMNYFKDRPQDLLLMNFDNGDGWEKLCTFLNKIPPNKPFPMLNMSNIPDQIKTRESKK